MREINFINSAAENRKKYDWIRVFILFIYFRLWIKLKIPYGIKTHISKHFSVLKKKKYLKDPINCLSLKIEIDEDAKSISQSNYSKVNRLI